MFLGKDITELIINRDQMSTNVAVINGSIYNIMLSSGSVDLFNKIFNREIDLEINLPNHHICLTCCTNMTDKRNYSGFCQNCIEHYNNMKDYNFETIYYNSSVLYKFDQNLINTCKNHFSISYVKDDKLFVIKFILLDSLTIKKCDKFINYEKRILSNNIYLIDHEHRGNSLSSGFCNRCYNLYFGEYCKVCVAAILERTWMNVRPHLIYYNKLLPELNKYILQILCFI